MDYRKRVERKDKIARVIISLGGYGVITSIAAIMIFLFYKSLPLIFSPSIDQSSNVVLNTDTNKILAIGMDSYKEIFYTLDEKGILDFYTSEKAEKITSMSLPLKANEKITLASKGNLNKEYLSVVTDSGAVITAEIKMVPKYEKDSRVIVPSLGIIDTFVIADNKSTVKTFAFSNNKEELQAWVWFDSNNRLSLKIYNSDDEESYYEDLTDAVGSANITSLALTGNTEILIAATEGGELFWFDISDPEEIELKDNWKASDYQITKLAFLIGDNTLIVGDSNGGVSSWFPARVKGIFKFSLIHNFDQHHYPIQQIYASPRNRSFLTLDTKGTVHLNYSTTGKTELELNPSGIHLQTAAISPKSNGIIVIDDKHQVGQFELANPHPETTLNSLFSKTWYEGYEEADFVWQSTGGSDDFEPKFSLIPLIFGTLKGTLFSMLFSIPLALLAAIYVSQFAPKKFAGIVKPTIEIMSAIPSVVIGFVAGLYFSPLFEKNLMTLFLILIILPAIFVLAVFVWKMIPEEKRVAFPLGSELIYLIPAALIAFATAVLFSNSIESVLFGGNINQWIYETFNVTYDQRNSLVVGFALGFAVVPIIFTISEDAMSNVPKSLTSASLALGASRWQTVYKIVLPASAGGIFAAIMLGLGRAIGETMIVLMATGNTPIMDLSPFNGFRAMSANIAVEIPEAPVDGTLYRVLFLTALILFIFTFVLNSGAAWISDKLRKKYARF